MVSLSGAKASDSRYVLMFGEHEDCRHTKHVARIEDYTFVFCKETKLPMAIYCGSEIVDDEDVLTLVQELAEKYSLVGSITESPFFENLAKALLDVSDVTLEG